jgi:hypothetical protein
MGGYDEVDRQSSFARKETGVGILRFQKFKILRFENLRHSQLRLPLTNALPAIR